MKRKVGIIVLVIISIMLIGGIAYNVYARYMLSKRVSISLNTSDYYFEVEPEQTEITTFPTTLNIKVKNYKNNNFTDSDLNYTLQATGNDFVDIQVSENKGTLKGGSKQEKTFTVTIDKKDNIDYFLDNINLKFNITTPYTDSKEISLQTKSTSKDNSMLVDFSGNSNNGEIYSATVNNGELILDGIDDIVKCGMANYDFKDSITMIIRTKFISFPNVTTEFFGNWEGGGGGFGYNTTREDGQKFYAGFYGDENKKYNYTYYGIEEQDLTEKFNTFIITYNGNIEKLYINGKLVDSIEMTEKIGISPTIILIGANPNLSVATSNRATNYANMNIKNAMIFDRAITDEEAEQYSQEDYTIDNKEGLLLWYDVEKQYN